MGFVLKKLTVLLEYLNHYHDIKIYIDAII